MNKKMAEDCKHFIRHRNKKNKKALKVLELSNQIENTIYVKFNYYPNFMAFQTISIYIIRRGRRS
jgi:hypothetical protein